MSFFLASKDIGIDLGTSNTLLYVRGKGILLREPSVIAIDTNNGEVLAVGSEAKKMIGRTPEDIVVIRPLRYGVIADFNATQQMLKKFIDRVSDKGFFINSRIVICHPSGITEVEKRAISEAAWACKVILIEEAVATALGAGLPINESTGAMVVDIGGGTTEIAVICLGRIVTSITLKIAGDEFDEAIINYVRKEYKLIIGERTAEEVKIEMGSVYSTQCDMEKARHLEIKGRDLITGLPKVIIIKEGDIRKALKEPVALIIDAIRSTLEKTAPELARDISDKGIILSGGGALLKGLDEYVTNETHIRAYIAKSPLECVVLGAGKCLDIINNRKSSDNQTKLIAAALRLNS